MTEKPALPTDKAEATPRRPDNDAAAIGALVRRHGFARLAHKLELDNSITPATRKQIIKALRSENG